MHWPLPYSSEVIFPALQRASSGGGCRRERSAAPSYRTPWTYPSTPESGNGMGCLGPFSSNPLVLGLLLLLSIYNILLVSILILLRSYIL